MWRGVKLLGPRGDICDLSGLFGAQQVVYLRLEEGIDKGSHSRILREN